MLRVLAASIFAGAAVLMAGGAEAAMSTGDCVVSGNGESAPCVYMAGQEGIHRIEAVLPDGTAPGTTVSVEVNGSLCARVTASGSPAQIVCYAMFMGGEAYEMRERAQAGTLRGRPVYRIAPATDTDGASVIVP